MSDAVIPDPVPQPVPPAQGPLGPLALSLSGGGYRAAAFHLGSMRFLYNVDLLKDVVGLSTVSGGTICGMAWVVSALDGKPFSQFHTEFSSYLRQTNVIQQALDGLTGHRDHGSHAWASLIRSAADVYSRPDLFGDRRFAEVLGSDTLQLEEAIFNSTEFHTALDFRFRRSKNERALLGNVNYRLPREVAQHIRLADIVAASSCFPGGFEPFVFPQHFHWTQQYPLDAALNDLGADLQGGLPLMDGGIYDNQGIDSLLLAFKDSSACTLLISDVSAQNSRMYDVPANPTSRGWITLNGVSWMGWGLLALAVVAAFVLAWHGFEAARVGDWTWEDYFLYLVPGALTAAVASALVWVRRRLADANRMLEKMADTRAWPSFRKLTVPEFVQMVTLRLTSLMALTSSIFMSRVRGLVYGRAYADPAFKDRRVSNLIYSLTQNEPGLWTQHPWLKPKPHLVSLAQEAEQMPTTLWFTDDKQFYTLEGAGEATTCYVLLRHIVKHRAGQYETEGLPLYDLFTRLRKEWDVFQRDAVRLPVGEVAVSVV
ncbi:patatin-like phospholipase family protein [Longimicrobium sp.]|uniref:patatin-like phospholipase family protein n=1 Tax=Longimicrobium sp. TaxID=2029185 RepID=UPI002E34B8A5|nr:patatin-like phospholipase family protein [Longimicrobium sp.]HEX6042120.1 patatin-like phospholipase family protein [Longimicrobium sp.]